MDEAVVRVVSIGGKTCKMNWVEEQHAGVVLAKPPPMLKSVREKDSTKYRLESDFVEYLCVIGRTLGFWCFLLL